MDSKTQPKFKLAIIGIVVLVIGIAGMMFLWNPGDNEDKYTHDSTRQKVDVSQSDFVRSIENGKPVINDVMGAKWDSKTLPIKEQYKDVLKEKVAFFPQGQDLKSSKEVFIFDTYDLKAFPTVSSFAKKHAEELRKQNPNGRIKVLHDGDKAFVYQWRLADSNNKTTYIELGKVELTTDGLMAVKYINKGTDNLEGQRRRAINLFGTM